MRKFEGKHLPRCLAYLRNGSRYFVESKASVLPLRSSLFPHCRPDVRCLIGVHVLCVSCSSEWLGGFSKRKVCLCARHVVLVVTVLHAPFPCDLTPWQAERRKYGEKMKAEQEKKDKAVRRQEVSVFSFSSFFAFSGGLDSGCGSSVSPSPIVSLSAQFLLHTVSSVCVRCYTLFTSLSAYCCRVFPSLCALCHLPVFDFHSTVYVGVSHSEERLRPHS